MMPAMPLNEKPSGRITVDCMCRGRMVQCPKCNGTGSYTRRSCPACEGVGKMTPGGPACPTCRGQGWNPIDDVTPGNTVYVD